eukprot:jgi/Chrzof1/7344/Cz02g20120.t1
MEATAPAALALSVTFDAVSTLGLVLMSFDGPFVHAMLLSTANKRLQIAASLGDLLALALARGTWAMLPLLGVRAALSQVGMATTALLDILMTAWLLLKALLAVQVSDGHEIVIPDACVTVHVPMLLAAEVLGVFMTWLLFALMWVNRAVIKPSGGSGNRRSISLPHSSSQVEPLVAVEDWLSQTDTEAAGDGDKDLSMPLLGPGRQQYNTPAVCIAQAPPDEAASFTSATSNVHSSSTRGQSPSYMSAASDGA